MDFDKKTVFAFLLIGLVLLLVYTPTYQKLINPDGYKQSQLKKEKVENSVSSEKEELPPEVKKVEIPTFSPKEESSVPEQTVQSKNQNIDVGTEIEERLIHIETDLYKATLSNKGASLIEWILKEYDGLNEKPVTLLPDDAYGTLGIDFITREGDTLSTKNWMFSSDLEYGENITVKDKNVISMYADLKNGRKIIKEFEFINGMYAFNLKIRLENLDGIIAQKKYFLQAPAGLLSTEPRLKDDMFYAKAVISASGQVEKKKKTNGEMESETGDIDWVAVRTKYFTLALAPKNGKGTAANIIGNDINIPGEAKITWKKFSINLEMPFLGGASDQDDFLIYFGPIDDSILKEYNIGLRNIMDMGWVLIKPFSQGILWSFKKMHTFIPNYGLVIILFSILIKIILYPLTHKSFESMQKMKDLQPKMSELKEKYSSDPQRMQKETMALYKEEGVNPMGSCLPTLLQMPLLFALFQVFRSTIELRGEGFIFWIKDLSLPDTITTLPFTIPFYGDSLNILPLFMGVTMFFQQKMTITDPKQKSMVYIMPIFLTFLFNSFPSGLNLYYSLFNIFSIVQQKYISPVKTHHEEVVQKPKKKM